MGNAWHLRFFIKLLKNRQFKTNDDRAVDEELIEEKDVYSSAETKNLIV